MGSFDFNEVMKRLKEQKVGSVQNNQDFDIDDYLNKKFEKEERLSKVKAQKNKMQQQSFAKSKELQTKRAEIISNRNNNRVNLKQIEAIDNALNNRNEVSRQIAPVQNKIISNVPKTKSTNIIKNNSAFDKISSGVSNTFNDIGKSVENTWLGLQNGLIDFNTTKGRNSIETTISGIKKLANDPGFYLSVLKGNKNNDYINNVGKYIFENIAKDYKPQFQEQKQSNVEKMQSNADSSSNVVSKYVNSNIAPAIGQMLPALIPGAGMIYMAGSSAESYREDAKNRGMSDFEASMYGAKMSLADTLTGMIPINKILKTGKMASNNSVKNVLKDIGITGIEEAIQEGCMEPISELMAGDKYSNWDNMGNRILSSALAGGLVGSIMSSATAGIGSSQKIIDKINNGQNVSKEEINKAISDAKANGIDVDTIFKQNAKEVINEIGTQQKNNASELPEMTNNQASNVVGQLDSESQQNANLQQLNSNASKYQFIKSDNEKINNFRQDASKFWNNSEETRNYVNMIEKIIKDKDIAVRLDDNLKTTDGKIVNGSYSNGVITINPNSTRAGEFIAVHELTHAIGTKDMLNIVENYRKSNSEFDTAVQKLLQNYKTTELNEEALSDVSAQLFGNQEFINNLAKNEPNIFQKIYSEIKYLWHQFRGYKNQDQFVEDLYYKWTQAYRSNNKLNQTINYHVSENLSNDIDNILINGTTRNKIQVRDFTPKTLVDAGLEDLPMEMKSSHIRENILTLEQAKKLGLKISNKTHYHGLGKEIFIKAIDQLDSPVAIYRWKDNNGKNTYGSNDYIVLTELIAKEDAKDGRVIVPLFLKNINGRYEVKTVYRKNGVFKYLSDNKNYLDKLTIKRTNKIDKVQFPVSPKSSSSNSIASSNENINTTTKYSIQESENNSGSFNLNEKNKIKTVYRKFSKDFHDKGYTDLNHIKITNIKEVADVSQVFRNPKYETFRIIYIKGEFIVGQEAISSRIPGETRIFLDENDVKNYYKIKNRMERLGADGYYLVHNHPSGTAVASKADIETTNKFEKRVPGFKGHVIVNSGTYATIYKNNNEIKVENSIKIDNYLPDEIDNMMSDEPWTKIQLKSRNQIASLMHDVKNNSNYTSLILVDSKLYPRIILDIPNNFFNMKRSQIDGYIRNIARQNGADRAFIATINEEVYETTNKLSTITDTILYAQKEDEIYEIKSRANEKNEAGDKIFKGFLSNTVRVGENSNIDNKNIDNINLIDNSDIKYSQNNQTWKEYLEKNYKATGTRTNLQNIKLPINEKKNIAPIRKDINIENIIPKAKTEILPESNNKETNLLDTMYSDKLSLKKQYEILNQKIVNKGYYVDKLAEKTGNLEIKFKYDRMLGSVSEGQYEIEHAQTDNNGKKIGKSINEIWKPVEDAKCVSEFSEYLLYRHNLDRIKQGKPIFGENINAETSKIMVNNFEKLYPEFKEWANDIYTFNKNQLQNEVDAGILSEEAEEKLNKMYQSYVTVSRAIDKSNNIAPTKGNVTKTNNPIKKAVGGNADINPLKDAMAKRAIASKQAIRTNELGLEMMKVLPNVEDVDVYDANNVISSDDSGAKFIIFDKGKAKALRIDKGLYESLQPTQKYDFEDTLPFKTVQKLSETQRSVLTVDNPLFMITNFFKDLQDGMFNSKYASKFLINYGRALREIKNKGKFYELYKSNGGESNTYFDYNKGVKKTTKIGKFIEKIRNLNEVVEMAPRLSEFISTIEDGKSINEAMYNSAEVTTNFKRGGEITKFFNRNGANFLNASVQGLSKQVRNLTGQNGLKGYTNLLLKATVLGVAPAILNHMLLEDDEDYNDLPDYVKDTYYLFKTNEGEFLRIPKGRVLSIFGSTAIRTIEYAKGNEEAYKGLNQTVLNQMAPNNPFTSNIFSPIGQAMANKTWFDGDLVPTRLKNELPKNQYDETTDSLSKWIGQTFNLSPIKINYLLDQYSGGIGDVILPILTPQARNNPLSAKFTIDSVTKNKNISKFYEVLDEQTKIANDIEPSDEDLLKVKYLTSMQKEISELSKEKREIQMSDLKNDAKKEAVREIQSNINKIAENALNSYEKIEKGSNYAQIDDKKYYKNSNGSWTALTEDEEVKNQNISLKSYADFKEKIYKEKKKQVDSGKLEKTQDLKDKDKINIILNSNYSNKEKTAIYENYIKSKDDSTYDVAKKLGISIDTILNYKLQDFSADKEDDGTTKGKTISGSAKEKVLDYLSSSNLKYEDKLILYGMKYALDTKEEKKQLFNYINSKALTKKDKLEIYGKMSSNFTVYKDGTVKIK